MGSAVRHDTRIDTPALDDDGVIDLRDHIDLRDDTGRRAPRSGTAARELPGFDGPHRRRWIVPAIAGLVVLGLVGWALVADSGADKPTTAEAGPPTEPEPAATTPGPAEAPVTEPPATTPTAVQPPVSQPPASAPDPGPAETTAPPPAAVTPPPPAPAPPAPTAPPVTVEQSTTSIELFLSEDPSENSATMFVGARAGVDDVLVELLADPPTEGTSVPVQVRVTNKSGDPVTFPGELTVTVIGQQDGRTVAEQVLRLPGVTELAPGEEVLLTGEILLGLGTTTIHAELPVQRPSAG